MTLGILVLFLAVAVRLYFYHKVLKNFYKQVIYGMVIPYTAVLSIWFVHTIHSLFSLEKLIYMFQNYPDFIISTLIILVATVRFLVVMIESYRQTRHVYKTILQLPHRRFKNFILLDINKPLAFNVGFVRPVVVVSKGVFALRKDVKSLILQHEKIHCLRRDSLKLLLFKLFLPSKGEYSLYKAHLEITHDRKTLKTFGKRTLVEAIKSVVSSPLASVGMDEGVERRIEFITCGSYPTIPRVDMLIMVVLSTLWIFVSFVNCHT